jgi:hypothetical protein
MPQEYHDRRSPSPPAPGRKPAQLSSSRQLCRWGRFLHEPSEWPQYDYYDDPVYYAAFVRDPDGNNIEAVWHTS